MESVWDKTTKIIQDKLSKQNFDTWIKPIKIVSMEDKCVQLAVPNKFFKDWLLDNYFSTIKHSLQNVVGIEVDIEFILSKDKEKKPDPTSKARENSKNPTSDAVKNKNLLPLISTIPLKGLLSGLVISLLMRRPLPSPNNRQKIIILCLFTAVPDWEKLIYSMPSVF